MAAAPATAAAVTGKQISLNGLRKAAVLIIILGPERSAPILKRLDDSQVEQLTFEIASLRQVPMEIMQTVVREFKELDKGMQLVARGGIEAANSLLEISFGPQRSQQIIQRLTAGMPMTPFGALRRVNASQLLEYLRAEHPQTIALILTNMPPQTAAFILSELPQNLQAEVSYRIATTEPPAPDVMREVERVLTERLSPLAAAMAQDRGTSDGLGTLVQMMSSAPRAVEKVVLASIEERSPELAEKLRQAMLLFEDLVTLDDRSIQRFLREVDSKELGLALKGASTELRDRIFKNMSQRAAELLKEDMEFMGPVRLREVEQAQQHIISTVRRLEEQGEIVLSRGDDGEIVV